MIRTLAMLLGLLCVSCTTPQPVEQTAVEHAYAVVADHVFPGAGSLALIQNLQENSRTDVWTSKRYGRFLLIYADIRSRDYPFGIRGGSGSNGPNFVFRFADGSASLVYSTGYKHAENRLALNETEDALLLLSYGHSGLSAGAPGRHTFRWSGVRFESCD